MFVLEKEQCFLINEEVKVCEINVVHMRYLLHVTHIWFHDNICFESFWEV